MAFFRGIINRFKSTTPPPSTQSSESSPQQKAQEEKVEQVAQEVLASLDPAVTAHNLQALERIKEKVSCETFIPSGHAKAKEGGFKPADIAIDKDGRIIAFGELRSCPFFDILMNERCFETTIARYAHMQLTENYNNEFAYFSLHVYEQNGKITYSPIRGVSSVYTYSSSSTPKPQGSIYFEVFEKDKEGYLELPSPSEIQYAAMQSLADAYTKRAEPSHVTA